jgi:hypothetical protein
MSDTFGDNVWTPLGLVLFMVSISVMSFALLRAAKEKPPTLIAVSLALLTVSLLAAYLITKESELIAVVGVAIGALATSLTSIFDPDRLYRQGAPDETGDQPEEESP